MEEGAWSGGVGRRSWTRVTEVSNVKRGDQREKYELKKVPGVVGWVEGLGPG